MRETGRPEGPGGPGVAEPEQAWVVLHPPQGAPVRVLAEIADTEQRRALGLMFRASLSPDAGMLFVFPAPARHTFWMAHTYVPLDLIFIGEQGKVLGVVESAEPMSLEPLAIEAPSLYVLEVVQGLTRSQGIGPGTSVQLPQCVLHRGEENP